MFKGHGVDLLLETGQERADELLAFLHDVQAPNVFINFDPANMILYGAGDPIAAMHTLGAAHPPRPREGRDAVGQAR